MHLSNFCLNHSPDRPQLLFALIDHFASMHHQIGEKRKSRLKVRARWGAANISCLSTKRSKKWAKSCKKGQKCLQIRLSVGILITFQLLFTDRHKIVSLKFNVTVKQHTMWIILSVSLDLSVFVCWPNRFTDRIVSHVFDWAHGNQLEPKGQSQLYLQLLSSAQIELSSTQSEFSSAQIEFSSTKIEFSSAQIDFSSEKNELSSAQIDFSS